MTLTLDFQGQILKMLYLKNGRANWHGTKGMWVDRMLDPHCDFVLWPHQWPWPLIFKVKFWKCCISRMGGPIDMERKGCKSIGCYTHIVTLNCELTSDLDLWFPRSNFENAVSKEWGVDWHGTKRMWFDRMLDPHCDFELWPHPWPWPLIFKVKFWKSHNSRIGCPIDMEQRGCESLGC